MSLLSLVATSLSSSSSSSSSDNSSSASSPTRSSVQLSDQHRRCTSSGASIPAPPPPFTPPILHSAAAKSTVGDPGAHSILQEKSPIPTAETLLASLQELDSSISMAAAEMPGSGSGRTGTGSIVLPPRAPSISLSLTGIDVETKEVDFDFDTSINRSISANQDTSSSSSRPLALGKLKEEEKEQGKDIKNVSITNTKEQKEKRVDEVNISTGRTGQVLKAPRDESAEFRVAASRSQLDDSMYEEEDRSLGYGEEEDDDSQLIADEAEDEIAEEEEEEEEDEEQLREAEEELMRAGDDDDEQEQEEAPASMTEAVSPSITTPFPTAPILPINSRVSEPPTPQPIQPSLPALLAEQVPSPQPSEAAHRPASLAIPSSPSASSASAIRPSPISSTSATAAAPLSLPLSSSPSASASSSTSSHAHVNLPVGFHRRDNPSGVWIDFSDENNNPFAGNLESDEDDEDDDDESDDGSDSFGLSDEEEELSRGLHALWLEHKRIHDHEWKGKEARRLETAKLTALIAPHTPVSAARASIQKNRQSTIMTNADGTLVQETQGTREERRAQVLMALYRKTSRASATKDADETNSKNKASTSKSDAEAEQSEQIRSPQSARGSSSSRRMVRERSPLSARSDSQRQQNRSKSVFSLEQQTGQSTVVRNPTLARASVFLSPAATFSSFNKFNSSLTRASASSASFSPSQPATRAASPSPFLQAPPPGQTRKPSRTPKHQNQRQTDKETLDNAPMPHLSPVIRNTCIRTITAISSVVRRTEIDSSI